MPYIDYFERPGRPKVAVFLLIIGIINIIKDALYAEIDLFWYMFSVLVVIMLLGELDGLPRRVTRWFRVIALIMGVAMLIWGIAWLLTTCIP